MALTNYAEDKILQHVFMGVTWTPPANLYVALFSQAPTDAGDDGVEIATTRKQITFTLGTGGAGRVTNQNEIAFTGLPAETIEAAGLYDAATAGNLIAYGDLATPITPVAGGDLTAPAGMLNFYLG